MKNILNREHSFKKNIQIYSFLFCLPIIVIALILKLYFNGPMQNDYVKQHNDSVVQEVNYLDNQIGQIELSASNWGQNLEQTFSANPFTDISSSSQIQDISRDLFFFQNSTPLVQESLIYVFNETNPFVISGWGTWNLSEGENYQNYKITNGKSYQWKKVTEKSVAFIQDISSIIAGSEKVYFITTLNNSKILDLLKVSATEKGSVALAVDGQMIVSSGDIFNEDNITRYPQEDSSWKKNHLGDTYSLVSTPMKRLSQHWVFYSAAPIALIAQPILHVSNILFLIGIILFILMAILSQIMARLQYQPIDNMMTSLFGKEPSMGEENEFDYLTKQWQTISQKKEELENQQNFSQVKLRQSILGQILEGKYSYLEEKDFGKLLQRNGWNFPIAHYKLLYIRLGGPVEKDTALGNPNSELFILENLLNDITSRLFFESSIIEYQQDGVFLFIPNGDQKKEEELYQHIFKFINRVIKKYVIIIVGKEQTDIGKLGLVANEVSKLRFYQRLIPDNQLIRTTISDNESKYLYPTHIENKIMGKIERNESDGLLLEMTLFTKNLLANHQELGFILEGLGQVYDKIHSYLSLQHINETSYISKNNLLKKVSQYYEPEDIAKMYYEDFLSPILTRLQETNLNSLEQAVKKAVAFLQEEYKNPGLSLEETADYVGLEASYLSREFKKTMHINFIDYLTDYRLEMAKDLLANSNLKINEIAEEIGYNSSYFNRLFKKKFDLTPGQYRKNFNK